MSDYITLHDAPGSYSIRGGGAVLGESGNVVELREGDHKPVLYVPREDLAMAFFDRSDHSTHCPHKGDASYFTLQAKSGPVENAAWSYEDPKEGLERIKNHLAFYADKITVEKT